MPKEIKPIRIGGKKYLPIPVGVAQRVHEAALNNLLSEDEETFREVARKLCRLAHQKKKGREIEFFYFPVKVWRYYVNLAERDFPF